MKKFVAIITLIMVFAASSFAGFEISVFGGYTTVAMTKVNKEIDTIVDALGPLPSSVKLTKNHITQGFIIGSNIGYSPIPGLLIGPQIEMLLGINGLIDVKDESTGDFIKYEFSSSLIPILGGLSYMISLPGSSFSIGGGAYFGYGLASAAMKASVKFGAYTVNNEAKFEGGCFTADIIAKAKMAVTPLISVGLQIGYRLANVAQMKATEDNAAMGLTKGDVLKDTNGDDLPFDFGGLIAALDIGFSF
ncbi:MAG: hypothetical protein N3E50_01040 [Candidatus Goldbacteria bacterium]|nr:hypothetical protein [Candidatus Goldiibacteriota bacterium]